ncbi:MAG: DegQ family serine endoprotease [Gemmatimonadaceae bacterium]
MTRARVAVIVVVLGGACSGASPLNSAPQGTARAQDRQAGIEPSRRTAITDAVARVANAVVTVQTEVVQRVAADPFEQFFGGRSAERVAPGLGSGFITRADGIVITNAHVVAGAARVAVAMRDGTTYPARPLGVDETNDIAVLKIDARNLPVAVLGNSNELLVGEWVIAIGNPYGFYLGNSEPSVTVGVLSGTGRNLLARSEGSGVYADMLQTDASINPGNSGGPLVNAAGDVIGVNSSIFSPSGGSIGLGFAIPINRVKRVTEDLLAHGAVRRPWTGVKLRLTASENPRDALAAGVVVRSVAPGSPAARGGILPGDQLVRAGERPLRNPFDWEATLLDIRVGEPVVVRVRRSGREFDVTLTVADLPEVSAPKVAVLKELELVTLTPAIRADKGIRTQRGAYVYRTSERVAEDLGVQPGDVIVQINQTPIETADQAARALDYYGGRGGIRLFFEHGGRVYSNDVMMQ